MNIADIKSEVTLQVNGLNQGGGNAAEEFGLQEEFHQTVEASDISQHSISNTMTPMTIKSSQIKADGRSSSKWKEAYDQCRKYNKHWEDIFPWVNESENGKPYCQWCGTLIIPKKHALTQHHKSMRHRANAEMYQESGVLQADPGVGSMDMMSNIQSMPSIEVLGSESNHVEYDTGNDANFSYIDGSVDQENTPMPVKKKRGRKPKSASAAPAEMQRPSTKTVIARQQPKIVTPMSFNPALMGSMKILVDVPHFHADELKVRVSGKDLEVEAKHEEREDEHGRIGRYFIRKYALPDDAVLDQIASSLSEEGVLTIEIPKKKRYRAPLTKNVPVQKIEKTVTPAEPMHHISDPGSPTTDFSPSRSALSLEDE